VKTVFAALACGLLLSACGERPQHTAYEDGRYAGKPDTPVWQSEQFDNDRAEWQRAIRDRNLKQSEYTRMRGGG
jgi:outer membrane biogenesis lipoprotein LolB